ACSENQSSYDDRCRDGVASQPLCIMEAGDSQGAIGCAMENSARVREAATFGEDPARPCRYYACAHSHGESSASSLARLVLIGAQVFVYWPSSMPRRACSRSLNLAGNSNTRRSAVRTMMFLVESR